VCRSGRRRTPPFSMGSIPLIAFISFVKIVVGPNIVPKMKIFNFYII
jgi:hypothetical protein